MSFPPVPCGCESGNPLFFAVDSGYFPAGNSGMTFKVREICENLWQIFYQTEIVHNIIEENPQNRYQKKICQSIRVQGSKFKVAG